MKRFLHLATLFGLLFFLYGCGFGDWEVDELYVQKIEGTSKVLYKYDAWGGRDSHNAGYVILDSTEKFEVNFKNDLPFYYLQEPPTHTSIKGVSHICSNSCGEEYKLATPVFIPIKCDKSERHGIKIVNFVYQYKGFAQRSGGFESFKFEAFTETRDSLWFYEVDEFEHGNRKHLDTLKFRKTDVAITQDKNFDVSKIIIEDLIVDQTSNEIRSNITYRLTPKAKLNSKSFSDYGIFKQVVE
jgi:hypothetical protein